MDEKNEMLRLAREAIEDADEPEKITALQKKRIFERKAGVFVSVYVNDDLRGCIGNLDARDLQDGIIRNAQYAAYSDTRFLPIRKDEFSGMKVHVNILSEPRELKFADSQDLLKKLDKKKGYIIERDYLSATFLPSVWDQLPDKEDFLSHLCMKAGMRSDEWKKPGMKVLEYDSEEFSE